MGKRCLFAARRYSDTGLICDDTKCLSAMQVSPFLFLSMILHQGGRAVRAKYFASTVFLSKSLASYEQTESNSLGDASSKKRQ